MRDNFLDANNRFLHGSTRRQFLRTLSVLGIAAGALVGFEATNARASAERLTTFRDASGLVTVSVFQVRAGTAQQHFVNSQAGVPPDMVVIGGGALAGDENGMPIEPGALLTASYPNDQLSAWVASSKDHMQPCPHFLTVYAIGLSIQGMSRASLADAVSVSIADSGQGAHPEATAAVPDGFLLVGGGFRVDWNGAGNLGTASFPSSNYTWAARSKDHEVPDPANIRSYAICLREFLPVGRAVTTVAAADSSFEPHPASSANLPNGFALTGGGAEVHWRGAGNLLWKLQPTITSGYQGFAAASKDHDQPDPATITTYALGIQIR
jgi:hypothetical protein